MVKSILPAIERSFDSIDAGNRDNDTFFEMGLVMGLADCIIYAGLDKNP